MKRLLIAITLVFVLSVTALAGDMPGVGASVTGEVPAVGPTSTAVGTPAPVPGDMPSGGSATSSETESNLIMTMLLMIITVVGR